MKLVLVCLAAAALVGLGLVLVFWPAGEDDGAAPTLPIADDPYKDAPPTRIAFSDVSATGGIDAVNHSGRAGRKEFLPEAVGPGASWFDYDGDGWLDLYVPDGDVFRNYDLVSSTDERTGRTRPLLRHKAKREVVYKDQLWHNNGDGTFTNVAEQAGIDEPNWSFGSTVFDLEGDGDLDVYVCNMGPNVLWRNEGDGTFTDVAAELGVAGGPYTWSTAAAVGDVDDDGRLDLYVAAYSDPAVEVERLRVMRGLPPGSPVEKINGRACPWKGIDAYCGPVGLKGEFDSLYRQKEDGTFEDMTDRWGVRPRVGRYAFTVLMFDHDQDGLLDIYVANDSVENFMWQQFRDKEGHIQFRDTSNRLGIKLGSQTTAQASMGMAVADVNGDGLEDIFITNFSHDYNNLYVAEKSRGVSKGVFYKDRGLRQMGQAVYYDLSWGCGFYDFDNDGDLDLFVSNGHVYKEIDLFRKTGTSYEQLNALFECMDAQRLGFREIGEKGQKQAHRDTPKEGLYAGDGMQVAQCSRQAAFGDFDNDGLVDVFVQNMNTTPTLLRNTSHPDSAARWIKLHLHQSGGNREALGARVEVTAGGRTLVASVVRQKSFLGCDDPRLHFGLGAASSCSVKVIWPGAARESSTFEGLVPGALYELDRESGTATRQALPQIAR